MDLINKLTGVSTLLQDVETETKENTSDRIAANASALTVDIAQYATKEGGGLHQANEPGDSSTSGIDPMLYTSMFSRNIFLKAQDFGTGQSAFEYILMLNLREEMFRANRPAGKLRQMWKLYRSGIKITIQCNTPTGATGSFVVFWSPYFQGNGERERWSKAMIFNFPHVVFNIGTMNVATLNIPYASSKTYMETDQYWDHGSLNIMVLSPYSVPSGMPTGTKISVFGGLVGLSVANPRAQWSQGPIEENIKASRSTKFKYTIPRQIVTENLGVANLANSVFTTTQLSTALVGERVMYDKSVTGQKKPVRDLLEVCKIPAMPIDPETHAHASTGIISWPSSKTTGQDIFRANFGIGDLGNLGLCSKFFAGWNGTIIAEVTFFSSVMHKGKLMITIDQANLLHDTNLESGNNLQYALMDLGLNSTLEISIPYMGDSWVRDTSQQYFLRISMLVVNELTFSATAKNSIEGMLRFRAGDDFRLYFPKPNDFVTQISWGSEMDLRDPFDSDEKIQEAAAAEPETTNSEEEVALAGLADAGNSGSLTEIVNSRMPLTMGQKITKNPISPVRYTDLFTFMARSWLVTDHQYDAMTSSVHIPVNMPKKGHGAIMNYFQFFCGELVLTVSNDSDNVIEVAHTWVEHEGDLEGAGALLVPSRQITTFTAPYYNLNPVVNLTNNAPLGHIYVNCGYLAGSFKVFLALRCPNFFIPRPFNKKATTTDLIDHPELYITSRKEAIRNLNRYRKGIKEPKVNSFVPPSSVAFVYENRERAGWRADNLKQCGDVEENPGPNMLELVYKHRGLYKHYGVTDGEKVFHLDTEDIMYTIFTGRCKTRTDELDGSWIHTGQNATASGYELPYEMDFSVNENCDTFAAKFIPHYTQGEALKVLASIILATSLASTMYNQDVTSLFGQIANALVTTFSSNILGSVLRYLLRLVLYSILFCHAPNLMTGGSMAMLLFLDYQELTRDKHPSWMKAMIQALMEGDMQQLVESIAEGIQDEPSTEECHATIKETKQLYNQGMDDFNKFSTMFKNVEWWLNTLNKLYQKICDLIKPSQCKKFAATVEKHREQLVGLLSTVCKLNEDSKNPRVSATLAFKERYEYVNTMLNVWIEGFTQFCPKHDLLPTLNTAKRIMERIVKPPTRPKGMVRPEPIGVLIRGAPGQGKSFLSTMLVKLVSKKLGLDPGDVFTHPTGSNYMDGYNGQFFHIIDDLGQNSDDEEFKLLCQLISSVPFTVPMARLDEKATWYVSRCVIATTNRGDLTTKTINSKEALERRFIHQLTIRAKRQYTTDGRLDVAKFRDSLMMGVVWETEEGKPIDVEELAEEISQQIKARELIAKTWDDFVNQGPEETFEEWQSKILQFATEVEIELFGETPQLTYMDKFRRKVGECIERFGDWLKKNMHWFSFVTVLGTIIGVIVWYCTNQKKDQDQVYSGFPGAKPPKKTLFQKASAPMQNQGPLDELTHISRSLIRLVADGVQVFGVAIGDDRVLIFGHADETLFNASEVYICYRNMKVLLEKPEFTRMTVGDAETDLAIIKTNAGFRMASAMGHVTNQIGKDPVLLWKTKIGLYTQAVSDVVLTGAATTAEGTFSHQTVTYKACTGAGTCGGLLVTKVGGMYKILGMHIAGNGVLGRAVMIPHNQGELKIVPREPGLKPVHMNQKTRLMPSPLHGLVPVNKEPAALSDGDPRCKTGVPSQQIYEKNKGNKFVANIKEFDECVARLKDRFLEEIGSLPPITIEEACFDLANPIDMSTSPGHKYTSQNLRKKDLLDPQMRIVSAQLRADVEQMINLARKGRAITYFTTSYKDELRGKDKVESGKTRVIEASNLDYTVAFRMLFGRQLDLFCATKAEDTGVAMGINPYTDWTGLVNSMHQYCYDFDYKGFDGSLSDTLMLKAGEVLCSLTTEPIALMGLLLETIYSNHHGPYYDYQLIGSNPSGTPFTTLLNCVCNLLVVDYFMNKKGIPYLAVTYGDDLVLSTPEPIHPVEFKVLLSEEFGMNITPGDKSDTFKPSGPYTFSFLKRKPVRTSNSTWAGALEPEEMMQNIMWCRGEEEFKQQLTSFELELSLHGEEIYNEFLSMFALRGVHLIPYTEAKRRMRSVCFQL